MITDLSEESTPEAIFMARGLPYNIYTGKIQLLIHMSLWVLRFFDDRLREYRYGLLHTL